MVQPDDAAIVVVAAAVVFAFDIHSCCTLDSCLFLVHFVGHCRNDLLSLMASYDPSEHSWIDVWLWIRKLDI